MELTIVVVSWVSFRLIRKITLHNISSAVTLDALESKNLAELDDEILDIKEVAQH